VRLLERDLLDGAGLQVARVVDEHVDAPDLLQKRLYAAARRVVGADVERDQLDAAGAEDGGRRGKSIDVRFPGVDFLAVPDRIGRLSIRARRLIEVAR
jgi:hypothetical protein